MTFFWVSWGLVCLVMGFSQQKVVINSLYEKRGNVSIMAIFNHRSGNYCNEEVEKGLEEIASAIWTVETLNNHHYLPGITIGLSLFGVCEIGNRSSLEVWDKYFNEDDNYIGILTTAEIHNKMLLSKSFINRSIVHIEHVISADMLTDATVQLLINLHWMNVNEIISDSANILKSFREKASEEGIYTEEEFLLSNRNVSIRLKRFGMSPVIVMIASFAAILNLSKEIQDENIKLILTPTDFVFDISSLDLPKNTIISLPPMGGKTALLTYTKNVLGRNDYATHKPPAKGPLFLGAAASILKFLKPIKKKLEYHCQNADFYYQQPCVLTTDVINGFYGNKKDLLSQKSMKITPDDVEETLKVLKIEPNFNDEMFLYITSIINANASEDLAIFQIFNLNTKSFQPVLIIFKDNSLSEITNKSEVKMENFNRKFTSDFEGTHAGLRPKNSVIHLLGKITGHSLEDLKNLKSEEFENITSFKILKKGCDSQDVQSHMCSTFSINHTTATPANDTMENNSRVAWRFLAWVSINTSLGFVGVTCTLSTMLFIITRLCKDDMLEGSPYFTLLLMIFVILTYASAIPFHVDFISDNGFICWYQRSVPPVIFAALFSLLLSRSFVIVFREAEGEFESHSNGYLQSILCFFMIGVQISLISQNWFIEKSSYDISCTSGHDTYKIFFALGYDFFLLFLLACVSPFILRSKQNYKEGLLFSICVFFITVVWSAWISFYVLLPLEHKNAAVAIGLNSTASVLLFCIFIPQTYFMAASYNQKRTLRSFSSLNRNILSDVSNSNFKSNQTLNESAFGNITYKNDEMGLSNTNFLTSQRSAIENINPERTDNFVEEAVSDLSHEGSQPN